MYSDRRGKWTKTTPNKTFQTKDPLTKPPDKTQNPREQLRENLYRGRLSGIFVIGQLKIGGSEMCDVLFLGGVPGCVTKCDRGSKLAKNSVTYFMDSPFMSEMNE